jgi:hypothetical protein
METCCEQGQLCPHYDILVVGAGITGLYVVRELLKRHPRWRIALAERYKGLGGRTYSYSPPDFPGISWEMGAGRVRKDHTLVMRLLKEYGLHWIPIGTGIDFLERAGAPLVPNPFETGFIPVFLEPLSRLPSTVLGTHTIEELMNQLYGAEKTRRVLETFPYRAEVTTLRADLALEAFLGGGEMGSHKGYGVVKEGFGELVARMRADIEKRGATILPRHRLLNLKAVASGGTDLDFEYGYNGKKIQLRALKGVVLALHKDAVAEIPAFRDWKLLRKLKTQPLLRTYAIFPVVAGKSWFTGFQRIVTPERPRYILPIDASKGVIMISYTDADDTTEYMRIQKKGGDKALERTILGDVWRLFPDLEIPDPLFFRSHPWETGATYWLPGTYNPVEESKKACSGIQSLPNVWVCGESWSTRQAWVEGALEHAEECLRKIGI